MLYQLSYQASKVIARSCREERENLGERVTIGFGFTFWWKSGAICFKPIVYTYRAQGQF